MRADEESGTQPPAERSPNAIRAEWTPNAIRAAWALMMFGALVRIAQFVHNRSLWYDEALLALNIVSRSPAHLLKPLDYNQGAPAGFLLLEKLSVHLLGNTERALRLLPLIMSLAALPLAYALARRELSRRAGLFALTIIAASEALVYYGSEAKQYSGDVACGLAILFCASIFRDTQRKWAAAALLFLVGAAGMALSHPALLFLIAAACWLYAEERKSQERTGIAPLVAISLFWCLEAAANYLLFLRPLSHSGVLRSFWANGFMPHSLGALHWLIEMYIRWFTDPAKLAAVGIGEAITIVGAWRLFARSRRVFRLIVLPILVALLFSALGLFPFGGRMILFSIPLVAMLIGAGLESLWDLAGTEARVLAWAVTIVLFLPIFDVARTLLLHPPGRYEVRPVMESVARRAAPGDLIFLTGRTLPVFRYYSQYHPSRLLAAYRTLSIPDGDDYWDRFAALMPQLSRNPRAWFLVSPGFSPRELPEEPLVRQSLARSGKLLERLDSGSATALLYEMHMKDRRQPE
jgi:uncharacterized membrane protein